MEPLKREQLRRLYNFGADYMYAKCDDNSPRNRNVCNKMAIYLITCSITVNLFVILSYALALGAPLYKTSFTDENEMILPIILPFTDPDTPNGFLINYTYQMMICMTGSLVIPACELIYCILKNNVSVTAAVIENALVEFEIRLKQDDTASKDIYFEFRNILLKILDFDRLK